MVVGMDDLPNHLPRSLGSSPGYTPAMAPHISGPLHWEQLGKTGRPVVFFHPNPLDHSCWIYQMDHFSTWYRCVSIDLPGYGKSPTAEPGLTIADMARACWEVMDEVTHDPAIVVGLSVGWHTVMQMAHQQPERTLAIILSGCAYRASIPPWAGRRGVRGASVSRAGHGCTPSAHPRALQPPLPRDRSRRQVQALRGRAARTINTQSSWLVCGRLKLRTLQLVVPKHAMNVHFGTL